MNLPEYLHKYPLTRDQYSRHDVQKIRAHAFKEAVKKPGSCSDKQRRYYFGVIVKILSNEIGYTKEEMHQELGEHFRSYEAHGRTFIRSITDYDTAEMEEYMEAVRRFAALELSITIPLPNETELDYEYRPPRKKTNDTHA